MNEKKRAARTKGRAAAAEADPRAKPGAPAAVNKKKIIALFKGRGAWTTLYTRIKFKICPLIPIEPHIPRRGRVLDLGCGNGLFAAILKRSSPEREIIGLDLDKGKIDQAKTIFQGWAGMDFRVGDVVASDYPRADIITIIDVLYLIPFEAQETILAQCRDALPPGGVLAVKDMDTRPRWKYIWNILEETLAVKIIGFTLGHRFYFQGRREFAERLNHYEFDVEIVPLHKGYWYPHILYLARKRGSLPFCMEK
jgi:2-polyprenyl-3-methyl-5-hydroxy-6-metoxy-1,4-benzoquinol methylase